MPKLSSRLQREHRTSSRDGDFDDEGDEESVGEDEPGVDGLGLVSYDCNSADEDFGRWETIV